MLLSELQKKDIQIESGEYLQYRDYTHKFQKECQGNYGVFCGSLEDSNLPSTEKYIEFRGGHVYQKCF